MNVQLKKFIKNFSYSFTSNIISVFINMITLLLLPKLLSVSDYGYYQLYVFYSSYVGFFHLGLCDGIYLRYGGDEYRNLNRSVLSFQFWGMLLCEIIMMTVLSVFIFYSSQEFDIKFVLWYTLFTTILIIPKTMLSYILQTTNKIKQYSVITISEKLTFLILILAVVLIKVSSYKYIFLADLISKSISLIISIKYCKDIVIAKICSFIIGIQEVKINIKVGSKLMIANIAGSLILGTIRQAIQNHWSIEVFGKVSLSITISNMLMLFVGTISIVLFPMLRRMSYEKVKELYSLMRNVMMIILLSMLLLYFPSHYLISHWLPKYADSLIYMSILFPVCIYESKTTMLINTYLKTIRKENILLYVNITTMLLSILLTFYNVYILENLNMTILAILILFAFRCIIGELLLSLYIKVSVKKDILLEIIMTIVFVASNWFIGGFMAFCIYLIFMINYLFMKKGDLKYLMIITKANLKK